MNEEFHLIEEALLNSIPARQTVLMDGWVVRLNNNYTYRANCICPLRYAADADIGDKVRRCEELFIAHRLPPVFKVTPVLQEGLAEYLLSQNYQNVKTVKVMRCPLETVEADDPVKIHCSEVPDNDWLAASAKLTGVEQPELMDVHCQSLKNIAVNSVFVEAIIEDKIVGCGYGTVERGYVGIYDLHVNSAYRCRGIGTAICRAIFRYGIRQKARFAYLIVHSQNQNAISLYAHQGFVSLYEYNFYCRFHPTYKIVDA